MLLTCASVTMESLPTMLSPSPMGCVHPGGEPGNLPPLGCSFSSYLVPAMTQVADSWNPDIHSSIATELLSRVSGMYVFMCAHVCACAFVCVMVARSQSQVVPWISLNLIFWGTESLTLELTDCLG